MSAPARRPRRSSRASKPPQDATNEAERPRITPRNSAVDAAATAAATETPYADVRSPRSPYEAPQANDRQLRQLAGLIQKPSTPIGRASSAGPASTRRSTRRTPSAQTRTPGAGGAARAGAGRRAGAPSTPHALRALQQRRAAALTPGRDRRRSGKQQRETPRDALRQLSKILAPTTQPVGPSPQDGGTQSLPRLRATDDFEIDTDLPPPELSIPLDDDDDDDSFQSPRRPRLSAAFDEDNTQHSVELPRRAISEQPGNRFSFGRLSDRFGDLAELGLGGALSGDEGDSVLRPPRFDDYEETGGLDDDDGELVEENNTEEIRGALQEASPRRQSDGPAVLLPEGDEDTTFNFAIPTADLEVSSSPAPQTLLESRPATTKADAPAKASRPRALKAKKTLKRSRHGIEYPSLPAGVIKHLATTFARSSGGNGRSKLGKDTLAAITQASDWFFEQVADDAGTYAAHAGRKTVEEVDVVTLMKRYKDSAAGPEILLKRVMYRQRQINATTTPFSLAQRHLPRELLQEVRMPPASVKGKPARKRRRAELETVDEED
ncbi:MAG: hypothetical protein M1832_006304 [Thelocarpon impressellum]|nr:MAG: hypothetical protein M1832_006304 [Thelocarpon impressellum]